jgi:CheY-like chemotaxis protein
MNNGILLIDDDLIVLKTLSLVLSKHGIKVETESNPQKAIDEYSSSPYNIVLTDMQMPQMDGIEVIRRIKDINPLCNIIVLTAYSNMGRVIDCIEMGACDYITKPIGDIPVLLDILQAARRRVDRWRGLFGINLKKEI